MLAEVLILISGIPLGFLIAYLTRDELVVGRPWFQFIIFLSIMLILLFVFLKDFTIVYTLFFIFIVTSISLIKSYDKNFIKNE